MLDEQVDARDAESRPIPPRAAPDTPPPHATNSSPWYKLQPQSEGSPERRSPLTVPTVNADELPCSHSYRVYGAHVAPSSWLEDRLRLTCVYTRRGRRTASSETGAVYALP
jgi:hypothetical protein